MSRSVKGVTQQLESEIQAAAMSTAMTAEIKMRTAVEGMRRDVQLQIDQHRKDSRRRDEEARRRMDDIAIGLERLTKQLNDFRPISETVVGDVQKQVSSSMDARLNLQSERIDNVNIAVEKAQKTAKDNSDMLENLLIGIENMSENVKQFREEMEEWRNSNLQEADRVYQETAADLL